jgi:hypothetical protein
MMNPSGYIPEDFQQAEIPEPNVHNSEADLEEVPPPTGKTRNKKSVSRPKLGNFNPDEDKNLVKSWLEISCDPIISNGQKRDRMWERIMKRFNSRRASNPKRSLRSLQSRWDTIKGEVTLFASYYADSIRENPSGMSDGDKVCFLCRATLHSVCMFQPLLTHLFLVQTTHAIGNFAAVLQRKFAYLHCWELMKDTPKWQDPSPRAIAIAARGEGFGEDSTAATETVDLEGGQSSPDRSGAQARRPMGRDSAKAAKKKANFDAGSSSSAEYAARMQDLSLQRNTIMQEESVRRSERFQQLFSVDERRFEEMRRNNEALIQIEQSKLQFMREQHELEKRRQRKIS